MDVGSQSIKLAQVEQIGAQVQIISSAVMALPEGAALSVESLQQGWLSRTLRDELSRGGFKGRIAAGVLSMSLTESRALDIPPGSYKERREMIALELQDGSGRPDPVEFDFWDTRPEGETQAATATVNVLAASQAVVAVVAAEMQRAGLICRVLDGGQFTLTRAAGLVSGKFAGQQPAAVLDWGHQGAHLVVRIDGQPAFSRVLKDCGVGSLVARMTRTLSLSNDECHELLATCGVPDPFAASSTRTELQNLVRDLAAESFNRLTAEIKKTLSYLRSQKPDLVPSEVWLTGGGATIRHAAALLSAEAGLPFSLWTLPRRSGACRGHELPLPLFAQAAALSELGWIV